LGGPTWFNIGDLDMATHLERTRRLNDGESLTDITSSFCERWGVKQRVFPMTDSPVRTMVKTIEMGWMGFQEYFVKNQCHPTITEFRFDNIESASLPREAQLALENSDWVIICPSNPFVSIDPILKIKQTKQILSHKKVLAVSPIVDGKAIKGPAAKMFLELGLTPSAYEVLRIYKQILDIFVINNGDGKEIESQDHWDIIIKEMNTVMIDRAGRKHFAREVVDYLNQISGDEK
jgi:LPPG:FO 2-phospho-L-lactate transferase